MNQAVLAPCRKVNIVYQRHRGQVHAVLYASIFCASLWLLFNPAILDSILPANVIFSQAENEEFAEISTIALPTTPKPTMKMLVDFHFLPKDYLCRDIFYDTGFRFNHTPSYLEHLASFQSAASFADIIKESVANEQSWMFHEMAKNPAVKTVCETGFKAGHNSYQWLTAQEESLVYSFEDENRFNYTKEMAMFITSEFPDRFYIFFGDTKITIPTFAQEYNVTRCDLIFIDSTHDRDTVASNLKSFAAMASPHNIVILDTHHKNATNPEVMKVWENAKANGLLRETFRCHFASYQQEINIRDHQQNGLLVGSFNV